MTKLTLTREQHKADIFQALKSVMSHFSYNSAHDITDVFKAMLPDSIITQHMSCGPTKLSYLISFGIAPYFMDLLLEELKDAPCFVISFDESFNEELEKEQMDFIVRYFKDGEVKSQGVKLSYKSYKILYFWNCPIKSYIFSKCPINPIFSTKTAIFVNSFKHFQGMGYVSQLYVRGMASLHLMYHPVHAE